MSVVCHQATGTYIIQLMSVDSNNDVKTVIQTSNPIMATGGEQVFPFISTVNLTAGITYAVVAFLTSGSTTDSISIPGVGNGGTFNIPFGLTNVGRFEAPQNIAFAVGAALRNLQIGAYAFDFRFFVKVAGLP